MTSKVRVTPRTGLTTPRAELSALVVLVRIMDKVMSAMSTRPARCTVLGDSTCTVATTNISTHVLQPFFSNRVVEVLDTMAKWGEAPRCTVYEELEESLLEDTCEDTWVDPIMHTPGLANISDLPTRGTASLADIDRGSRW